MEKNIRNIKGVRRSPRRRKKGWNFVELLFPLLVVGFFFFLYLGNLEFDSKIKDESYATFINYLERGEVKEIEESPPHLIATIESELGEFKIRVMMVTGRLGEDSNIMSRLSQRSGGVSVKPNDGKGSPIWLYLLGSLPTIFGILMVIYFIKRINDEMGGGKFFGQSKQKVDMPAFKKVSFEDIAGVDEAKKELEEVVDFLKEPDKFIRLGAKIPKGVLLLGRPGTGKTLLAKALASMAGVPFFSISGSEFEEMFVGLGAARVRSLFENAKKQSPSIIFIDEIDAVAKKRSQSAGMGNNALEQTLNQLLVAMDGFDSKGSVIVIAATNRPDVLDRALTRPGRFDRQVVVDAPTLAGREEILKVHAKNKVIGEDVDLKTIARKTPGFVGADLANVLNEAAILAARHGRDSITNLDVEEAVERVITGPEHKSKVISEREKKIVAYHEAGHALVAYLLPDTDPVHKISIIPRGYGALGYTLQLPYEDKFLISKGQFISEIKILMGGRAAEELIFNEITSGASNDIERATKIAGDMIKKYGMSEQFGPRAILRSDGEENTLFSPNYGEKTSQVMDEEITALIGNCYKEAKELLAKNSKDLETLATKLLEKEIIFGYEMEELLKSK